MYDIGWLDLEGCFYLSPSQVSQLLESLSNLTRLLVSARWNRELHLWRKVYESYAKKILCPCFLNYQQLYIYIYIYMYMYLYVLNSIHWNVNAQKKRKREIESTQNNSSGKINVGIKRYMFRRGNEPQGSNKTYMYMYI